MPRGGARPGAGRKPKPKGEPSPAVSALIRSGLTLLQQRFIAEYLVDLNATRAAIRAGYSAKNAGKIGPELIGKTRIAAAVQAAQTQRLQSLEVTADRVRQEMARIAFSDVRNVVTAGGSLKNIHDLSDAAAAAVSSVEVIVRRRPGEEKVIEEIHKIKHWDKPSVLRDLGRMTGLLNDHATIDHTVTVLTDARTRLAAAMVRALTLPAAHSAGPTQ